MDDALCFQKTGMELFVMGVAGRLLYVEKLREGNAGSLDGSARFCFKDPPVLCSSSLAVRAYIAVEICDVALTDEPCRRSLVPSL